MNGYSYSSGTSFSCPLTAGIMALWLDLYPTLSQIELQDLMQATAYKGILKDQLKYGPKNLETVNDFDKWLYGITHNIRGSGAIYLQADYSASGILGAPDRAQLETPFSEDDLELKIRKYLQTYTDHYSAEGLRKTPNLLMHWPFSQVNRKDILGSFDTLQFSGSVSIG